jgi:hypothetical protein
MRKQLRKLPAHLPLALFLGALAALFAGQSSPHLFIGNARHYLVALTDPHALGIRFRSSPDRDVRPGDPWLQIYHHQDLFAMIDFDPPYPSDFDSPFWEVASGPSFDHAGVRAGAGAARSMAPADTTAFLVLPHLFTFTATSLLLCAQLFLQFRHYQRKRQVPTCPTCRYDLRASPLRCPECGTPIPSQPRPPLFIRWPVRLDQSLRRHPPIATLACFLVTLFLANIPTTTTYLPPKTAPTSSSLPTSNHPITILYPLGTLLTAPDSPLTGDPQERTLQLEELLTTIDPPSWRINGGDLCSTHPLPNALLITAPARLHPQIHALLSHPHPQ